MKGKNILKLNILNLFYLLSGAAVFWALEFKREEEECSKTISDLNDLYQKFNNSVSVGDNNFNMTDFNQLIRLLVEAHNNGVVFNKTLRPACAHNWYYHNALFFAGTVVTTIGYGNISPSTEGGMVFCLLYAIFGIPLFGIMLLAIGEKMAKRAKKLQISLEKKIKQRKKLRQIIFLATSFTILMIIYCMIPAIIFSHVEDWSYFHSFYYTIITLTTIGFGDFVVGANPNKNYSVIYRVLVYFWILIGLAAMATVINFISDFYKTYNKSNQKISDSTADNDQSVVEANQNSIALKTLPS